MRPQQVHNNALDTSFKKKKWVWLLTVNILQQTGSIMDFKKRSIGYNT